MALGEVFSLADVISSANKIKADQQELALAPLRRKYLEAQVAGTEQAQQLAANQDQRAAAEESRKAQQFTVEQKVQNTTLVNAAAAEVMQNPAALERWLPDLQKLGFNLDPSKTPPEVIQAEARKIYESTGAALTSLSPALQEVAKRHAATLAEIKARAGAEAGLAAQQNRYQLGQIAAQGEQARLTATSKIDSPKPLPTGALRIVDDAKSAIGTASQSIKLVDDAIALLQKGQITLGPVSNATARARNAAGISNPASRGYASIKQTLEKLRNNYLLLAKGVQTEGDATRAWNSEIGESVQNDNELALQQLQKAKSLVNTAIQTQQGRIENVYANFGQEAPAVTEQPANPATPRLRFDAQGNPIQ